MSVSFNVTQTSTIALAELIQHQFEVSDWYLEDPHNQAFYGEVMLVTRAYSRFLREWEAQVEYGRNMKAVRKYHRMVCSSIATLLKVEDRLELLSSVRKSIPKK